MGTKCSQDMQDVLDHITQNPPKMLEDIVDVTKYQRYTLSSWAGTYALAVEALMASCANNTYHPYVILPSGVQVPRPLTFEESIQAIVENYNTKENPDGTVRTSVEREAFICYRVDTCTAIVHKFFSTRFKLMPLSLELVHITPSSMRPSINVDYNSVQGIELNMSGAKYNEPLTAIQAYKHDAWNALINDRSLLRNYLNLVFRLTKSADFGFYTHQGGSGNELRSLVNICRHHQDGIRADMDLNGPVRFIKVLER